MALYMAVLTVVFVAGLWLFLRNVPLITHSATIDPDADDTLDEEALRDYAAQVQAATGAAEHGHSRQTVSPLQG